MSNQKPVRPQVAPAATFTVPPQLAKVTVTGPGTVGLVSGTAVNLEFKPNGKGANK